jgi:copper homeostasis protein
MERHGSRKPLGAQPIVIEAAVESLASALAAEDAGANRIELCANLSVGGTTPDASLIAAVLDATELPVFMMIRPRGGGFVYSDDEIEVMLHDVEHARRTRVAGIVTGVLTPDARVDFERTRGLVNAASGLPVTFHRAFDSTDNLAEALEQLIQIGVSRVLTSGGAPTALEGASAIADLVDRGRDRLEIIAGGGVREHNVRELIARTGVREVHARDVRGILDALSG